MKKEFVFIMVRHISSEETNNYWIECYNCIRKFYEEKIIIVDDNSDIQYINDFGMTFINVEFVQSEYPKRAELLPYYYFYKNKYADHAVMIHDSVFIQNKFYFDNMTENIRFLWHHCHLWDDEVNEKRLLKTLNYSDGLFDIYDQHKDRWHLCVGVMSFISHQFLSKLQDRFKFFNLLDHIESRNDRMCLERIFGLLCTVLEPRLRFNPSIFGIQYRWGYTYDNYKQGKIHNTELPDFTKVFTGR
jgi:hypothetical protein